MKSSAAELGARLVVELHPSRVVVKAGAFPGEGVVGGRGGPHESGEEIDGAVEGVEDGP